MDAIESGALGAQGYGDSSVYAGTREVNFSEDLTPTQLVGILGILAGIVGWFVRIERRFLSRPTRAELLATVQAFDAKLVAARAEAANLAAAIKIDLMERAESVKKDTDKRFDRQDNLLEKLNEKMDDAANKAEVFRTKESEHRHDTSNVLGRLQAQVGILINKGSA